MRKNSKTNNKYFFSNCENSFMDNLLKEKKLSKKEELSKEKEGEEESSEIPRELEEFIEALDIQLANTEILGATLVIVGYLFLISAALQDKQVIFCRRAKKESSLNPSLTTAIGARIILVGIVTLTTVAYNRLEQIRWQRNIGISDESLTPFNTVFTGYILSSFANSLRVLGTTELFEMGESEVFV